MTFVYRCRERDGVYEIGKTSLNIKETNRTGVLGWCESRICETWCESHALLIVEALTLLNSKQ